MTDRVSSGSERLNDMLGGGLPGDGVPTSSSDSPESGKTILAQQYAFHNATPERPAIYLSTVSEPLEKILRYGQTLSFFDQGAIGTAAFYEDLGGTVNDEGLPGVLERTSGFLKERRPGTIVIDSFKALHPYARRDEDFRWFLHELAGRLSAFPVTSFWVGDTGLRRDRRVRRVLGRHTRSCRSPWERKGEREVRVFQVLKLRGSDFLSGKHAYRLSGDGVEFFPHWPTLSIRPPMSWTTSRPHRASRSSTRCSGEGIGPGPQPSWPGLSGTGQDPDGLALHLRGSPARRTRRDRHTPGERRPLVADRQRFRLVPR